MKQCSFGVRLVGDCRLGDAPALAAELELTLQSGARRGVFFAEGVLHCAELGSSRTASGIWRWPTLATALRAGDQAQAVALELELQGGLHFSGRHDSQVPAGLLRASSWIGPLTGGASAPGLLRLRFDVRQDLRALLRSVRLG